MKKIVFIMIIMFYTVSVYSHPGRVDSDGGHNSPNGYHFHRDRIPSPEPSRTLSTEYRDACQQIINARNPVEEIGKLSDDRLRTLLRFALGIPVEGQASLNLAGEYRFSSLGNMEFARRQRTAEEFRLFLQERREALAEYINAGDTDAPIIELYINDFLQNLSDAN
jgi:hypothetical protein